MDLIPSKGGVQKIILLIIIAIRLICYPTRMSMIPVSDARLFIGCPMVTTGQPRIRFFDNWAS